MVCGHIGVNSTIWLDLPVGGRLSYPAMTRLDRIEKRGFALLLAAGFALLLAFAFSAIAHAHHPAMHSGHQTETAPNAEAERSHHHHDHSGHHDHSKHEHGADCPMHFACNCPGVAYCSLDSNGTIALALPARKPVIIVLRDRKTEFVPKEAERTAGDDLVVRSRSVPAPPNQGWCSSLHSNIPRLRI